MATDSVIEFGRRYSHLFESPILEVGSKIQPGYRQRRPREIHNEEIPAGHWLGIDIQAGEGVDAVLDLGKPGEVNRFNSRRFRTIHCHCVLAHVLDIFVMAQSIQQLLVEGGYLYLSVPFAWKIHRIPFDLWRFTPQGIDFLFPSIFFEPDLCAFSTRRSGEFFPVDTWPEMPLGSGLAKTNWLFSTLVRLLRRLRLDEGFFQHRALLAESILLMIGRKASHPVYSFFPKGFGEAIHN
jgi:hypothetical protein